MSREDAQKEFRKQTQKRFYDRKRGLDVPLWRRGPKLKPIEGRFWSKVKKSDGCWMWLGSKDSTGYGRIGAGGRQRSSLLAHRVSWQVNLGEIPEGKCVLHRCDNPSCVNPAHLFLGSNRDNSQDALAKGRLGTNKLTDRKVVNIRRRAAEGERHAKLAEDYGVSAVTIFNVVTRRTWKHIA